MKWLNLEYTPDHAHVHVRTVSYPNRRNRGWPVDYVPGVVELAFPVSAWATCLSPRPRILHSHPQPRRRAPTSSGLAGRARCQWAATLTGAPPAAEQSLLWSPLLRSGWVRQGWRNGVS